MIEFEVKAPVPPAVAGALRARLGPPERVEEHADTYYDHPSRSFAGTDEALRVSSRGGRVDLTYKGPKLDAGSKARREIVVPLPQAAQVDELLRALGFRPVMTVRKRRELRRVGGFEVAWDDVPGLGAFVELERQLPEDASRRGVEEEALALLRSWGIDATERAGYLELLRRAGGREERQG